MSTHNAKYHPTHWGYSMDKIFLLLWSQYSCQKMQFWSVTYRFPSLERLRTLEDWRVSNTLLLCSSISTLTESLLSILTSFYKNFYICVIILNFPRLSNKYTWIFISPDILQDTQGKFCISQLFVLIEEQLRNYVGCIL